ncbi:PepSY-associated TM helix domain-containing protein [Reyranella sp.]|uniref:PepSY-associated TM helix domain-containing protein n=1 Tax=Reyranella sp. TaxID=1929291 RepID=UPI003BA9936E
MSVAAAAAPGKAGKVNRRLTFVRWVRKTHGWFGLWGALLGLLFGFSGIWLNHRSIMKLPLPDQQQINAQLQLPDPRPQTIEAMGAWLQQALKLDRGPNNARIERARPVAWGERGGEGTPRPLQQPERWLLNFGGPNHLVQAEYWVGNGSLSVRTTQNGFVATMTNLHKGTAMPVPWILLIDTLAGSMIFLSISGVILWWESHRKRAVGITIFAVAVATTVALAVSPLQF